MAIKIIFEPTISLILFNVVLFIIIFVPRLRQNKLKFKKENKMSNSNKRSWAEPFKIKTVELLKMTSREEREVAIKEAGYNTFL